MKKPIQIDAVKVQPSALDALKAAYDERTAKSLEDLHNAIVALMAESKLPTAHIIMLFEILEREVVDMAMEQCLGKSYMMVKAPEN